MVRIWLIRPGKASTFTPKEGTVQEWITSSEEINIRIVVLIGRIRWLEVSNNRIVLDSTIKESNSILFKSGYSYDQYHWWPIDLIVREGEVYSSDIYKIFIDGKAKNNSKKAGRDVQKYSISWSSEKYRFKNLFDKALHIIIITKTVIRNKSNIIWSCRKFICSIRGDALSCK